MTATNSTPRIAFCTTCRGRVQHLRQTLPRNIVDNKDYENCVFVVLLYASGTEAKQYLQAHHRADIESGRLVVYSYQDGGHAFKMALSKNIAMRCGILEGAGPRAPPPEHHDGAGICA